MQQLQPGVRSLFTIILSTLNGVIRGYETRLAEHDICLVYRVGCNIHNPITGHPQRLRRQNKDSDSSIHKKTTEVNTLTQQ